MTQILNFKLFGKTFYYNQKISEKMSLSDGTIEKRYHFSNKNRLYLKTPQLIPSFVQILKKKIK